MKHKIIKGIPIVILLEFEKYGKITRKTQIMLQYELNLFSLFQSKFISEAK